MSQMQIAIHNVSDEEGPPSPPVFANAVRSRPPSKYNKTEREWISLHPQAGFCNVSVDISSNVLHKDLAALLQLHANGLPLMISFDCFGTASHGNYSPLVVGLFHCLKCLASWKKTKRLRSRCHEVARFVNGPVVTLTLKDAVVLIDVLKWSKRFIPKSFVEILPLLRRAKKEEKISELLTQVCKPKIHTHMIYTNATQVEILGRQNRNQDLANKTAISHRKRLFASLMTKSVTDETDNGNSASTETCETFGLVGYKTKDGAFYPGFFSRKGFVLQRLDKNKNCLTDPDIEECNLDDSSLIPIPSVPKLPFAPRGKIEKRGGFHPYFIDNAKSNKRVLFPNLSELLQNQVSDVNDMRLTLQQQIVQRKSGNIEKNLLGDNRPEFQFCLRDGPEVKITELLGSGVWHMDAADEYFVAGIFDFQGRFVAAYYLSKYGFMIPGISDNHNRFVPTCKYDIDSEELMTPEKSLHEDLMQEFIDIKKFIHLPRVEDLRIPGQKQWVCVKDAVVMTDPLSITILSDAVFGEHLDINVYAGGDIGADGQLYLYGKYSRDGLFIPGALSITIEKGLVEVDKDPSVEQSSAEAFLKRFAIQLHGAPQVTKSGHKISGLWESQKLATIHRKKMQKQADYLKSQIENHLPEFVKNLSRPPSADRKLKSQLSASQQLQLHLSECNKTTASIRSEKSILGSVHGTKIEISGKNDKSPTQKDKTSSEEDEECDQFGRRKAIKTLPSIYQSSASSSESSADEFSILAGIKGYHHSDSDVGTSNSRPRSSRKLTWKSETLPPLSETDKPQTSNE